MSEVKRRKITDANERERRLVEARYSARRNGKNVRMLESVSVENEQTHIEYIDNNPNTEISPEEMVRLATTEARSVPVDAVEESGVETGEIAAAAGVVAGEKKKKEMSRGTKTVIMALVLIILLVASIALAVFFKAPGETIEKLSSLGTSDKGFDTAEFSAEPLPETQPYRHIATTHVEVDGEKLADVNEYNCEDTFNFPEGENYTDVEGIITFRGNNLRNDPTYGRANITENTMETVWTQRTGSLGEWSGNGWTGQPLIVKWPESVKVHMNMTEEARNDPDLVEVIYASMDGKIYFLNLQTGEYTREPMNLGFTFKGAGALDPRGYPIMYLGAGINSDSKGAAHVFVINLLDCTVMYEFGAKDKFALRGTLSYFDSSALVCAENDTLIYPGENGLLYLLKLNTFYDEGTGTLSVTPTNIRKWRYNGVRTTSSKYWWGMEDSAVILGHYLYIADNGGYLFCLDLNTLKLTWVQDVLDDTNGSPVMMIENGHPYIYISTSFHLGWRSDTTAQIPIWKIDAQTGEIVWQTEYTCYSIEDCSGGVQSTIAAGRYDLDDYIYVTVSRVGSKYAGVLACLRKDNGQVVFEHEAAYAWSSPDVVYNDDGSGRVLYATSEGKLYMLDGVTGEEYCQINLGGSTIEASPAVYNDMLVLGTRGCEIYGIRLK